MTVLQGLYLKTLKEIQKLDDYIKDKDAPRVKKVNAYLKEVLDDTVKRSRDERWIKK